MQKDISGTYRLVQYGYVYKADRRFEPISEWYSGCIHYSANGYMNVIVRFKEKPAALEDVVAYSGTYRVDGAKIVHHVESSVRPEYENQVLTRDFSLSGDRLETEFENTDEFRKFAIWERAAVKGK